MNSQATYTSQGPEQSSPFAKAKQGPPVVYFDYNATTPCDPRVVEKMLPYFSERFGNTASQMHAFGWQAQTAVDVARAQVAQLIGAQSREIFFTSGATEANNWVISGLAQRLRKLNQNSIPHFLTTPIEHSSVLAAMKSLAELNLITYDFVNVDGDGLVQLADLQNKIRAETKLLSVIYVNNEIGTIQNLKAIGEICHERKVLLHTDATQAVGKMPVQVQALGIDLLSCSAHKFYGPKGIGALYIRKSQPSVDIAPLLFGGGHEGGLRSGTLNTPGIVGMGAAAEISNREMANESLQVESLRNYFFELLSTKLSSLKLNGPALHSGHRAHGNLNITLQRTIASRLEQLTKVAFSPGSACQAENGNVSHVLKAIGRSEEEARSTLRLSLGRWTTKEEVKIAADVILAAF